MKKNEMRKRPPRFDGVREASDFWDAHDAGEYSDALRPVDETIELKKDTPDIVALDPFLAKALKVTARRRGVSLETLVNIWLEEKVLTKPH